MLTIAHRIAARISFAFVTLNVILACTVPARATEGGVFGGPIGGTDIRQAYLPPVAGIYGAVFAVEGVAGRYQNQDGNPSQTLNPATFQAFVGGGALLYKYGYQPFDFAVASAIQFSVQNQTQSLTVNGNLLHGHNTGFSDSFVDVFYASRYLGLFGAQRGSNKRLNYGLTFAFGLGLEIPWGYYRAPKIPSAGKNVFITVPSIAFTYLTGPNLSLGGEGTEISGRLFYESLSRNPTSLVQSGNLFDLDFAATERYNNLQIGIAGAYAVQINSDISATGMQVAPYGNKYSILRVGPVVAYDFPDLGGTAKLKVLLPAYNANAYNGTNIVISYARKLY